MENMSAFEIATIIPIVLFCLIFVICIIVCFISDMIEAFKKLFGRSFKEKVEERLSKIEQKLFDLTIETECNSDSFEVLREHVSELDEKMKQLNEHVTNCYF